MVTRKAIIMHNKLINQLSVLVIVFFILGVAFVFFPPVAAIIIGVAVVFYMLQRFIKQIFRKVTNEGPSIPEWMIKNNDKKQSKGKPIDIPNDLSSEEPPNRLIESILQAIAEKRHEDPLIGAKIGSKEIYHRIVRGMRDEKGVHIETLLCILGTLAGYSCQASVIEEFINEKGLSMNQVFNIVECVDGSHYFFGDILNKPLVESQFSIWSLAAGVVKSLGVTELIDINDIFQYVSHSVGTNDFGIPRIPDDHKPGDLPRNYLKYLWPNLFQLVKQFCPAPEEWPILFGLAIQNAIIDGKNAIAPLLALSIVMESAVPMSKIDFNDL